MTAFYIDQHEINDEVVFADYLKETMPFIEGTADVISPKPAHMKCSKATAEPRRRISEQAGDQGLVQRSRLSVADRQAARSVTIAVEGQ
jgi:hypothetical protein